LYLLCRYGQGHVLHFWDSLSSLEQSQLVADLGTIDLEEMQEMWTSSQSTSGLPGIQVSSSTTWWQILELSPWIRYRQAHRILQAFRCSLFEETCHDKHNLLAPQASKKVLFNMQQSHQKAYFGIIDLEKMWNG
jgi:hypothetical protein